MTYNDVFGLIAEYCNSDNRTLSLFADRWCRWPTGAVAHVVITRLGQEAKHWKERKPSIYDALQRAQIAIRNNM